MVTENQSTTKIKTGYTWDGPYPGYKDSRTRTKGIMKNRRRQKRQEAEARNAATPIERTKQYRLQENKTDVEVGNE